MTTVELVAGDGVTLTPGSGTLVVSTPSPAVSFGAGAPVSTPSAVGDIYVDTTGDIGYIAVGVASSGDWKIIDSGGANLTWTAATSTVASDAGTDAVLTAADGSNPGLMTAAQFTKLGGVATGATDDTTVDAHIADALDAHDASAISIVDTADYFGVETDVEGALEVAGASLDALDTRTTALEGASSTFDPLTQEGIVLHLIYNGTNSRFEYPGNTTTAPVLTGRVCTIEWEATSGNIPAQGTGVSDFRPGDKAIVRATEYSS